VRETIFLLALIAGQNSICLSMINGRENIQLTLKYMAGTIATMKPKRARRIGPASAA